MKQPKLQDKKLAEFTGIMLGDGSIGKYKCKKGDGTTNTQRNVKIALSSEEKEYAEHVQDLITELFNIKMNLWNRKDEKTLEIRSYKKDFFNYLVEDLELKLSPKWDSAKIPRVYLNNEYEKHVLRGYFDTDGSVVLTDKNGTVYPRLEMKIIPSPMQDEFIEVLDRTGIRFSDYDIGKGKVRVQMNGKKVLRKWMKNIGFRNPKHLNKAERVLS